VGSPSVCGLSDRPTDVAVWVIRVKRRGCEDDHSAMDEDDSLEAARKRYRDLVTELRDEEAAELQKRAQQNAELERVSAARELERQIEAKRVADDRRKLKDALWADVAKSFGLAWLTNFVGLLLGVYEQGEEVGAAFVPTWIVWCVVLGAITLMKESPPAETS